MAPDLSATNPVFYFSYANRDQGKRLTRFVDDLRHRVAQKMGIADWQAVGFRDVEAMTAGDPWEKRLVDALQSSRVLVPNYSMSYFESVNCGREIRFFLMRAAVQDTADEASARHPMIVPTLWSSEKELISRGLPPNPLASIYYSLPNEPDYAEHGLQRIIAKNPELYDRIVDALADHIVDQANREPLPVLSPQPAFGDLASLFQPGDTGLERTAPSDLQGETNEDTARPETEATDFDFPSLVFRLVVARQLEVGDLKGFDPNNIGTAVKEWVRNEAGTHKGAQKITKSRSPNRAVQRR